MQRLNLFLVIGAILLATSAVCAAAPEAINLNFNSAKYVSLPQTISKIFVGNGSIVKVKQLSPATNEIVITAQEKSGSTNIFVWTADGARYEYNVTVSDRETSDVQIIEREINLPNVNNVIVNVVSIPSLDIDYSLLSEKEIFVADKIKNRV